METKFADTNLLYFFSIIFKKITVSLEKQTFRKNVILEEKLDCNFIDDTGTLEDSPRLMFSDEECGIS